MILYQVSPQQVLSCLFNSDVPVKIEDELREQWLGLPSKKVPNLTEGNSMNLPKACARKKGIDVPLIANAPNMVSLILKLSKLSLTYQEHSVLVTGLFERSGQCRYRRPR